jgi:collagen type VII alpha
MATPNQIVVDSFNNNVDIQTNDNQLYITSETSNTEVNVTQPVTTVIQVSTVGLSGSNGTSGSSGSSGTSGSSGSSGTSGSSGSSGASGSSGSSGASGSSGSSGTSGSSGSSGTSGSSGSSGINGTSGSSGSSGSSGFSGSSGSSGASGSSGSSGTSGSSGSSGTSGSSGSSGVSPVDAFIQNGNSFGATALLGTNDSQDLQFETSGSVRMTISSSGNVGIGTTTPTNTLNVNGTTFLQGGQTTVRGSGATSATTALRVENSNASASLVVLDNGNVGIGTTSPTAILGISGSTIITGSFNVNAGTTTPHIRGAALRVSELANGAAGTLTLGSVSNIYSDLGTFSFKGGITGTTEFMFLSGSRVGIGTNNPTNTLQVVGGVTATSFTGSLFGTSSWAQNALTASFVNTASTNAFVQGGNSFGTTALLGTNDSQDLQFETSGSVRMTISSSGNVGIGTSTPIYRLDVSGSAGNQEILRLLGDSAAGSAIRFSRGSSYSWTMGVAAGSNFEIKDASYTTTPFTLTHTTNLFGIGVTAPTARLHVSGASNSGLFEIDSPAQNNIIYVSGSGNIGIGTSTPAYRLDISGSLNVNSGTTGQSSLSTGLIVNNDAGSSALYDFEVKTQLYDAIYVSSSNNSVTLMSNANGKIGFFGSTPTTQSNGWGATNAQVTKSFDADTITLAQLADVVGTLITELKIKGLLG